MNFKVKNLLIFMGLVVYFFCITYFRFIDDDIAWNFGFCYNFANGLTMYKDYNMVVTPLYPFLFGSLMKLLGNNMVIFYILNSFLPASIMFMLYKNSKKVFFPVLLLLSFISVPNYNVLCMLFLFILIYLEKNNKNDYLIGFILGLTFLTKSSIGAFLCLPTIYYLFKDFKKVIKRVMGFLIPLIICIVTFYLNGALKYFIDYCFLGLFDFAADNSDFNWLVLMTIIFILYLIRQYIKTRDVSILYILCFQIMAYPLFNIYHIMYSAVPVLYYFINNLPKKLDSLYSKISPYLWISVLAPIVGSIMILFIYDFTYDDNIFKYRFVNQEYYDNAMELDSYFEGKYDNVYFVFYSAYLNKLLLDIPINNYDLLLKGNLGYNGEERVIKEFENMNDVYFVVEQVFKHNQASQKIYDYVVNNTKYIATRGKYLIYYKR